MSLATDGFDPVPPGTRAAAARLRIAELQQRRAALAQGLAPTAEDVATAELRARQSWQQAMEAHQASAKRHAEAGEAHRRAAAAHEQAAMMADNCDAGRHQDAAEVHRNAADWHDLAAAADAKTANAEARRAATPNKGETALAGWLGLLFHQEQRTLDATLGGAESGARDPDPDVPATPVDRVEDDFPGLAGVDEGVADERPDGLER